LKEGLPRVEADNKFGMSANRTSWVGGQALIQLLEMVLIGGKVMQP